MKLSDFDYRLPKELIAKYPLKERSRCRLMVADRKKGSISHRLFEDITEYFGKGDLLVLNNTKVMLARLLGKRKTGARVEIFLLEKNGAHCSALVRPSVRVREGEKVILDNGYEAEILGSSGVGRFISFNGPVDEIMRNVGHVPLPPYIDRPDEESDLEDYQTVYCQKEGATASPTAGLHFTAGLIEKIKAAGVDVKYITLHTSYGTFAPIKSDEVEAHRMHSEYFEYPEDTAKAVISARSRGNKIFAVGTTTCRVLEHCRGNSVPLSGSTDLFIYPGYRFGIVDHLITNFHLPKSTLIILVSALCGREFVMEAYRQAIEQRYRFFSYGDAMLIV